MGKNEKDLEINSLVHFLDCSEGKKPYSFYLSKRNCIDFRNGTLALQRLKHSFVSNWWSWNTSLIGFLEWLAPI